MKGEASVMCVRRLCMVLVVFTTLFSWRQVRAQEKSPAGPNEFYAGYGLLANSSSGGPVNGWRAAVGGSLRGSLGVTVCALGFYSTSSGASQSEHTVLAGPQWSRHHARESFLVHGLVGVGYVNGSIPVDPSRPKLNFSFAVLAGAGLDTPFSRRLAWRIEGDYLRLQFNPASDQIHNLVGNFAHISTGLVRRFSA